jgi:transaldolase
MTLAIEIYYDGVNISKFINPEIKGYTTNISQLKLACITDYSAFIKESLVHSRGLPISFQLFDETDDGIEATAKKIQSYSPSIFVKIPVIRSNGDSNATIIKRLHEQTTQINVTAIFTIEQIDSLKDSFNKTTPVIVSIFGGRINDLGLDCAPIVQHAVNTFKEYPNVKILWAACRTIYNMFEAEKHGAHIVTVPEVVLSKMGALNKSLIESSIDTVTAFKNDGANVVL